jgi:hypothetical protein
LFIYLHVLFFRLNWTIFEYFDSRWPLKFLKMQSIQKKTRFNHSVRIFPFYFPHKVSKISFFFTDFITKNIRNTVSKISFGHKQSITTFEELLNMLMFACLNSSRFWSIIKKKETNGKITAYGLRK